MLKVILLSILALFLVSSVYAQKMIDNPVKVNNLSAAKTFNLTIKLDSNIDTKSVWYQYYDGKNNVLLPDTLRGKSELVIKRKYYSEMASFTINCLDSAKVGYRFEFLLTDKPAYVKVKLIPNQEHKLSYTGLKNAIPTEDSVVNKSWARRVAFMNRYSDPKENAEFELFFKQHPNFYKSDSLKQVFAKFTRHFQQLDMDWIKTQPNDYFSFWFFNNSVAQVYGMADVDQDYLQKQLHYYKTVFPARFINSIEGRHIIKKFEDRIKGIVVKEGDAAPAFAITTIDGKKFTLAKFKGKYVLLDFWATWCGPCMAELPFVKDIRKKYPPQKLAIIGVSGDINSKAMKAAIKSEHMNWLHYIDEDNSIRELYKVSAIPMLFLIDKTGKLLYKSDLEHADTERLPQVLKTIN